MNFTDANLKQLKERSFDMCSELDRRQLADLVRRCIVRLEAAEKVFFGRDLKHTDKCDSACSCCAEECFCGVQDDYDTWRKMAGK